MLSWQGNFLNQRRTKNPELARERTRKSGLFLPAGSIVILFWLLLSSCLTAADEDRRAVIATQSKKYRAEHFTEGYLPPKHDLSQLEKREIPGGVGYGYFFNSSSLWWTNTSIVDYYAITPTFLGGAVPYLYLTSTCRAQLGTESLVAYQGANEAAFWIFDWSQYSATTNPAPWVVSFDLPTSNPQYLTTRPDEFGVSRQMVHVRNGTYSLGYTNGLYNWQNQTFLFDFTRKGWDLIYSHSYSTTNLTNNAPPTNGVFYGSWGPIVETFQPYTNVTTVGFDLIRLFQDSNPNPFWLSQTNSNIDASTNWQLLTQAPNTSFSVAYGTNNSSTGGQVSVGSLCINVNTNTATFSVSSSAGIISPYWIATPSSNTWDNTVVGLPPGSCTITFSNITGYAAPPPQTITIGTNTITTVQATYTLEPALQSRTLVGKNLTCKWTAQSNFTYQLQYTPTLGQTNWSNVGNPVSPTNGVVTTTYSVGTNPTAFYRLMVIPGN